MTDQAPQPERIAYSITSAASALDVGRSSIYRLISEGRIEALALGGRTVIPAESLHAFVASLPPAPIRSAESKALSREDERSPLGGRPPDPIRSAKGTTPRAA